MVQIPVLNEIFFSLESNKSQVPENQKLKWNKKKIDSLNRTN